jgi:tRNA(Ser,Leu) C12 N-acetylase TAN1
MKANVNTNSNLSEEINEIVELTNEEKLIKLEKIENALSKWIEEKIEKAKTYRSDFVGEIEQDISIIKGILDL